MGLKKGEAIMSRFLKGLGSKATTNKGKVK